MWGLGLRDVVASDLFPVCLLSVIVKNADDTYLQVLLSSSCRSSIVTELAHIAVWAKSNNLKLDADKSRELPCFSAFSPLSVSIGS